MTLFLRKDYLINLICCFSMLILFSCDRQNKIELEEFEFYIPSRFEIKKAKNKENVLLTLNDPKGNAIIIQNNINILKSTLLEHLNESETLKSLHDLKFDSYIDLVKGYDEDVVRLDKIENIPFTMQTFLYMDNGIEIIYDLRIIQLGNNYYPFYCFGKAENKERNIKIVDDIIGSLSKENF